MKKSVQLISILALGWVMSLQMIQSALSNQVTAQRAAPVQITDIQITSTETGASVSLITTMGELSEPTIEVIGNAVTLEFSDTVLALPDNLPNNLPNNLFEVFAPVEGIALVAVSMPHSQRVQVTITGSDAPPTVDLVAIEQGVALNVALGATMAGEGDQDALSIQVLGAEGGSDYYEPAAASATRTDTPLRDVPQSIQIIPRAVLEDQQIIRLDEALRNLSGVVSGGQALGRELTFSIRGFQNIPVLRDGFRQFGAGGTFPETANLEQIEVLRGPSSILYGEVTPGGVINLVSERPLAVPTYQFEAQFGNGGLIRPSLDISGPVTEDGRLLYRLNALYQRGSDFQETDVETERFFISPVLAWAISDRTDLTLTLDYFNETRPPALGVPASGEGIAAIPFDRILHEPGDRVEEISLNVGYDLEHRFSDRWVLRNGFRYTHQEQLFEVAFPLAFDENTGTVTRFWASQPQNSESFTSQTNLVGEFMTGSVAHTVLFGFDFNYTNSNFNTLTRLDPTVPLPLDIFNPVYDAFPRPDFEQLPLLSDQRTETTRFGVHLQDQIEFLDNLILLAGLRFDRVEQTLITDPTDFGPPAAETTQTEDALTPRIGLVYQPIPEVSIYASYSQVFAPSIAETTTVAGDQLPFETGEGWEVGIKNELLDGRLAVTLAYFDMTRRNVASEDPNNPFSFIATGEQRSRGVELDVIGEILPGWNILGSYAYIDAEITDDNIFEVGNQLPSAPRHSTNLWTTYEIQSGDFQGLGFGLGFNFVDRRAGDLANSFEVDSYFVTNAALSYRRDNWRAMLNVRNLFNVNYIADTGIRSRGNNPGDPLTIVGSISVEF
ncbi:MAG: TonB-dependent siderophore receptor [Cyanobacteria bacterium J06642_9]